MKSRARRSIFTASPEETLVLADRIHPLGPGDPESLHPGIDSLLVRGGRVAAVGVTENVEAEAGPDARVVDLRGATLTPGLIDSHLHLLEWAVARREVDVSDSGSPRAAAARVARRADADPGEWVRGRGWNYHRWEQFPRKQALDEQVPDRPVALHSHDMHAVWLNSEALDRLEITGETPDPPGGRILRDSEGEPTGVLLEEAVRLATDRMPRPGPAALRAAVLDAQEELHRLGFTGVHSLEMHGSDFRSLRLLGTLRSRDRLRLRVLQHLPRGQLDEALGTGLRSGFGDEWVRVGGVKFYLDGTLGARTAWLRSPYLGGGGTGSALIEEDVFRSEVERAGRGGLSSAVHAIGDAAVELAVDALAETRGSAADLPPRVEHAQLVPLDRLSGGDASGLVFSVQPAQMITDWRDAAREWGEERCRGAFPLQFLADLGATLAFGSDAPVEHPDPRPALFAATTRRDLEGDPTGGWHPELRVTVPRGIRAYTVGPAYAAGLSGVQGRLLPGYFADFAAWDRDPFAASGRGLLQLRCVATGVGGELVWRGAGEPAG